MNHTLVVERAAKMDMAEAYQWYKNIEVRLSDCFYNKLYAMYDRILQNPKAYPVAGRRLRQASLAQFPYAVYYLCDQDAVRIFAVMHTSRDPLMWRKREH